MKLLSVYLIFFFLGMLSLSAQQSAPSVEQRRDAETKQIADFSTMVGKLYELNENEKIKDITPLILSNPQISQTVKQSIQDYRRKIFVFSYPSDGLMVKGFISLTPHPENYPLLVLFRSGNREFGLPFPGSELANYKDFTVITSTLRGGVSEGRDEFGGKDVDDMKNLMDFLPTLGEELQVNLTPTHLYFVGLSRGGMEMFLTLDRFPELQKKVHKAIALSGLLDLRTQIKNRPNDMKKMFIEDFGLVEGVNENEWINQRDPILTAPFIKPCLPTLIIQGTKDNRISLEEGYHMVNELEKQGKKVDYWEIEGGDHTVSNIPNLTDKIAAWLESPTNC